MLQMDFQISNFDVSLLGGPGDNSKRRLHGSTGNHPRPINILHAQFQGVRALVEKRDEAQKVSFTISGLDVFDPCVSAAKMEHRIIRQRSLDGYYSNEAT